MDKDVADQLKQWADGMGYIHRNCQDTDSTPDFEKLCRERTTPVWNNVVAKVKPLSQLEHIRKNILLSRLRKGECLSDIQLSGTLGKQVKLSYQLSALKKQKKDLFNEISTRESSIREIQKALIKKCAQINFLENHLKECQHKGELLRIKKRDCETFISWLDEVNAVAKNLCPTKAEQSNQQGLSAASAALEKCIKVVQEYQSWSKEFNKPGNILDEEEYQSEVEQRKQALWKAVSGIIGNIPPEQLWDSLLLHFMQKSVSNISSLASAVDLKMELQSLREKTDRMKPNQDLSAMHIKLMMDMTENFAKAEVSSRHLEHLLEEIAIEAEHIFQKKCDPADLNNSKSISPKRHILEWLRLRCRHIQLEAAKQALTDEIAEMKTKSRDLSSYAQRLKDEKAAIARLDAEIAEVKTCVEQGLSSISDIGNKLRKVRQGVINELESFSERSSIANDFLSSNSHDDTNSSTGTHRNTIFNSTTLSNEDPVSFSTPLPKQTKVNQRRDLLRMDETALTNVSFESIPPGKRSLKEVISTLRNAVSKESKTFFKLPLAFIPKVEVSTSSENISGLLIESPALIARLACTGGSVPKQLMQLNHSPITADSTEYLVHIFQNLGHIRAAQLQKLISRQPTPPTICASLTHNYLKVAAPEQEKIIRTQLNDIATSVANIHDDLGESRKLFDIWKRRPAQSLIPEHLQVDGRTFKEWKKQYDSIVSQLK